MTKNLFDLYSIKVIYAEKNIDFSHMPPYLDDRNRVMVPVRSFCETVNADVQWEEATKEIILTKDGVTVKFALNSDTYFIKKNIEKMDTTPVLINGRTYIPVRYIAEAFNMGINWDGKDRMVSLNWNLKRKCYNNGLFLIYKHLPN